MTSCFFDNNDEWHSPLKEMMRLCLSHSTGWGAGRPLNLVGKISEIPKNLLKSLSQTSLTVSSFKKVKSEK